MYQRLFKSPKSWVPNTLIEGHIPWFRDPKPKGTNPKGPKENSLNVESGVSWRILEPLSWTLSPERPLPAGNPKP